ncbi:MAG: extracellular elastinolytic metalloproteinase [Actinoplanes sp.]|nr:extracellular elastinolytic metalloproteinase [Actinoplanes sp.]
MKPLSAPSASRRWWAAGAGVVLLAGLLPAAASAAPKPIHSVRAAQPAAKGEELANYDSRTEVNADANSIAAATKSASLAAQRLSAAAKPTSAVRKLRDALGIQGIVDIDNATGTPRRVAKLDGFLTAASRQKPESIARAYLKAHADVFGLSAAGVDALTLRQDYRDITGTHHLSFVQSVAGVPVFGNGLKAHVAKDGRLIQIDGSPVAALPAAPGSATLTAEKARAAAVENVFGDSKATVVKRASNATRTTTFSDRGTATLVLFQTATGPKLAWQTISVDEGYVHVVDATSGRVLFRERTTAKDNGLAWPNYPGAAIGGTQQVVNLTKLGLLPNSPWLAGNVAHVYTDVNDDNVANPSEEVAPAARRSWEFPFTDFSAQVGGGCSAQYQCSWDPSVAYSWEKNRSQNAVQLYYFLGTWHDHLKADPIGFTRSAGNFEAVDGDAVQAQALDGADTMHGLPDPNHVDNANMSTFPDGTGPIMQMYLFPAPGDPTDPFIAANSGDEADVVYHEYTHGLSNRLVVDANGVSTLNSQQAGSMGEAWSDWYASDYLVNQGYEPDTKTDGDIQVGKYVAGGGPFRSEALDCSVGSTSAACPGTPAAGPGGYTYGDFGKVANGPEVHADGEIWAQTLWDLRAAIGATKAESLVTRAMELSPADPSYLDERNSILQADLVVDGGRLQKKIWTVFAHRGMGFFAGAVDGGDSAPVEDFSLPPAANTPRGSLTGTVTDPATSAAVAGATVEFGGHASGFTDNWTTITAADGTYTISGLLPGTYPKVFAIGGGYDPEVRTISIGARTNTANWALRRDWAAASGGGKVIDFNGADFTPFGCSPSNMIDQSQGSGWVSDVELTGGPSGTDTTAIAPRYIIIKLPTPVNVAQLTINPSTNCGLAGSASTGDYKVETSVDGTTWTLGNQGHFTVTQRVANPIPLAAGSTAKVQFVRYWMLGTQTPDLGGTCPGNFSGCTYVASSELGVYGVPAS